MFLPLWDTILPDAFNRFADSKRGGPKQLYGNLQISLQFDGSTGTQRDRIDLGSGATTNMAWAFNGLSVDVERREVRRGPRSVRVEPKVFDLLVYLIRHRDRVVRKDELINVIWGGRFISESALTTRINGVRRAVGDTGKEQHLIRTLRGKGFRFIGEVVDSVVY